MDFSIYFVLPTLLLTHFLPLFIIFSIQTILVSLSFYFHLHVNAKNQ